MSEENFALDLSMETLPGVRFIVAKQGDDMRVELSPGVEFDGDACARMAAVFFIVGCDGDTKKLQKAVDEIDKGLKSARG